MRNKNIFESVQFLNEGIVGLGVILSLPFLATFTAITGICIASAIEVKKLRKIIKNKEKDNEDIKTFNKETDDPKAIDVNEFCQKVKMNSKEKKIIESNDCSIYIQYYKNGNTVAYAIYDHNIEKYKFKIIDNSIKNKDVIHYIMALFELKFGLYGDGLKYFYPNMKFSASISSEVDYRNRGKKKIDLSKSEIEEVYKNIKKLDGLILKFLKTKYSSSYDIDDDNYTDYMYINIYFKDQDNLSEDEYDKASNKFDRDYKNIINDLKSLLIKSKFEFDINYDSFYATSSNIYPYINIKMSQEPDYIGAKIEIESIVSTS